jgi:hypothetical protein
MIFIQRMTVTALAFLAGVGAVRSASANTVHFEAESARDRQRGTITSPLLIKDDAAASGGSYLVAATGSNSPTGAPASTTDGVAKYTFSVTDAGSYRIWARVSAPNTGDDSFWVRMGTTGTWIRWNGIPLGAPYHWVLVKAEGAANPASFSLAANVDHQLQVAYREDGTRLDALFITNDLAFNPNAVLTGPPALPIMQRPVEGETAVKVSWSAVPGATSYTLERKEQGCSFNPQTQCCEGPPYQVVQTGLTSHKFTDASAGSFIYRVTAVGPTGASLHPVPQGPDNCFPIDPSQEFGSTTPFHLRSLDFLLAVTPPMTAADTGVGAPAGTNSTAAPPATGRARLDFETALPTTFKVWARVLAPTAGQDSFWVRVNDGAWFNWNNIPGGCDDVHDSSKAGQPPVQFNVAAGSHRIEWAYREGGARLNNVIVLTQNLGTQEQCSD